MFTLESIKALRLAVAAPAVHHVIQQLRHCSTLSRREILPPESVEVVKSIVSFIETKEGVSTDSLSGKQAARYIEILSDLLADIAQNELHTNTANGQLILENLRSGNKL